MTVGWGEPPAKAARPTVTVGYSCDRSLSEETGQVGPNRAQVRTEGAKTATHFAPQTGAAEAEVAQESGEGVVGQAQALVLASLPVLLKGSKRLVRPEEPLASFPRVATLLASLPAVALEPTVS